MDNAFTFMKWGAGSVVSGPIASIDALKPGQAIDVRKADGTVRVVWVGARKVTKDGRQAWQYKGIETGAVSPVWNDPTAAPTPKVKTPKVKSAPTPSAPTVDIDAIVAAAVAAALAQVAAASAPTPSAPTPSTPSADGLACESCGDQEAKLRQHRGAANVPHLEAIAVCPSCLSLSTDVVIARRDKREARALTTA